MKYTCCTIDNMISYICDNDYKFFFNKKNVVAVALGYKLTKGFYTPQKCIAVFVSNKVSQNQLCNNDLIPNIYKGIPTDVVESGYGTLQSLTQRVRPVVCGYSIGAKDVTTESATVGCLITDGKYKYMLTTNHATVTSPYAIGTPILQPSLQDNGQFPGDQVGTISKFIPLKPRNYWVDPKNKADAAAIIVLEESLISPYIYYINTPPLGVANPELKIIAKKVGRTTELTTGEILYKNSTAALEFHGKEYIFSNCVITSKMSEEGDSGSLLLNERNYALGLVMAGFPSYTMCSSIKNVLSSLDMHLVTD